MQVKNDKKLEIIAPFPIDHRFMVVDRIISIYLNTLMAN